MAIQVFIDGAEGTTGLRLADRLGDRADIQLLTIDPALRKDPEEKARIANQADVVFLCLPDDAAKAAVARITNPATTIIDASTAHRTNPNWVYGLPELSAAHREALAGAKRIANPGCHATGFISLVAPLIQAGVVAPDYPFTCHSVTGYSGAGRGMIAQYADPARPYYFGSPRQYALGQQHKHQPEMQLISGLTYPPQFSPIIADYYAGMVVTVPLLERYMAKALTPQALRDLLAEHYHGQRAVRVMPLGAENTIPGGMMDAGALSGKDFLEIYVCGHAGQMVLVARFDNLGKGASGAAIQCMNIACGVDETTGLVMD